MPLVADGFTVWMVTRRRGMPAGHSVADMADDYAQVILAEFVGKVDVVVGESYGGMIAQYLAANHPDRVDRVVLVVAACQVSDLGKDIDLRWATALSEGNMTKAGEILGEYIIPSDRARPLRRLFAPLLGRLQSGQALLGEDALIEGRAEVVFDARPVLPEVTVPVLLISGDRDLFFTKDAVEETARLIPDCTIVRYQGLGHLRAASSKRIPQDVLAFANRKAS